MTRRPAWPRLMLLGLLAAPALAAAAQTLSGAAPSVAAYVQDKEARGDQKVGEEAARQIQELAEDKRARTPAQRKIDSQLLYALKQKRGETRGVPTGRIDIKLDAEGKTLVDISAKVSARLISQIEALGAEVVSKSEKYHTIRARVALERLEALAGLKEVRHISVPAQAMTHGGAKTN